MVEAEKLKCCENIMERLKLSGSGGFSTTAKLLGSLSNIDQGDR